jgi:hypothetical protein
MTFELRSTNTGGDDQAGPLRRSPHVLATAQGDELVLFDLQGERYYTLNDVGSRVWSLLGAGATVPQIVDAIRREYVVPSGAAADPVEQDVVRLVRELRAAGLVAAAPEAVRHGS